MTLSSAFWALNSLAQHDMGIKNTLNDFFEKAAHLKQLLAIEQNAFSNYMTMLVGYAAIKDNPTIESSLSIYEKLGSAKDAQDAVFDPSKNKNVIMLKTPRAVP